MAIIIEILYKLYMEIDEKKTKLYVGLSMAIMIVGSIILAWIMAKNMQKDVSKERFKLTQIYKKIKDDTYNYDATKAKALYLDLCSKCHGKDGLGSSIYPPLTGETIQNKNKFTLIALNGLQGTISRGEKTYNGTMPPFKAVDHMDLAHMLNYIKKEFNQIQEEVSHVEVLKMKIDSAERTMPYQDSEL